MGSAGVGGAGGLSLIVELAAARGRFVAALEAGRAGLEEPGALDAANVALLRADVGWLERRLAGLDAFVEARVRGEGTRARLGDWLAEDGASVWFPPSVARNRVVLRAVFVLERYRDAAMALEDVRPVVVAAARVLGRRDYDDAAFGKAWAAERRRAPYNDTGQGGSAVEAQLQRLIGRPVRSACRDARAFAELRMERRPRKAADERSRRDAKGARRGAG